MGSLTTLVMFKIDRELTAYRTTAMNILHLPSQAQQTMEFTKWTENVLSLNDLAATLSHTVYM